MPSGLSSHASWALFRPRGPSSGQQLISPPHRSRGRFSPSRVLRLLHDISRAASSTASWPMGQLHAFRRCLCPVIQCTACTFALPDSDRLSSMHSGVRLRQAHPCRPCSPRPSCRPLGSPRAPASATETTLLSTASSNFGFRGVSEDRPSTVLFTDSLSRCGASGFEP